MQVVDLQKKVSLQSNKLSQSKADQNSRATHARMSCQAPPSHDLYQTACRPCAKQHELGMTVSSQQPVRCLCKGRAAAHQMSHEYIVCIIAVSWLVLDCLLLPVSRVSEGILLCEGLLLQAATKCFQYRHDSLVCRICMYPTL